MENQSTQVATSSSLEELMDLHKPANLTREITLSTPQPVDVGGFAKVYRGSWGDKPVAVKWLNPPRDRSFSADLRAALNRRLNREIGVWAALKHPNIVEFYGYATDLGPCPVMVSKWCKHGNASHYLRRDLYLTTSKRLNLTLDVAEGLTYLHSLKVIHGDLKPKNVLISDELVAQLCDFGLVSVAEWDGATGMNTLTPFMGTKRYEAYELLMSKENRDPRPTFASDVYAFGCVAYEFIERKCPFFDHERIEAIIDALRNWERPASKPENLQSSTQKRFWDLLESCWNYHPSERPSADNIVAQLQDLMGDYHVSIPKPDVGIDSPDVQIRQREEISASDANDLYEAIEYAASPDAVRAHEPSIDNWITYWPVEMNTVNTNSVNTEDWSAATVSPTEQDAAPSLQIYQRERSASASLTGETITDTSGSGNGLSNSPASERSSPLQYERRPTFLGRVRSMTIKDNPKDLPIPERRLSGNSHRRVRSVTVNGKFRAASGKEQGENCEYILVMGATGAGKTSFINRVSNSELPVGHGLKSCTSRVYFSEPFELLGRRVIMFDTPGFDDTNRTDAEILAEISVFLGNFYEQKNKLIGVIYLHDITNTRVGATAVRNIALFRKTVGELAAKNVVIVTSMWDLLVDQTMGNARSAQLASDPNYFGSILADGAEIQHLNDNHPPLKVIETIIKGSQRVTLQIQTELVEQTKKISETAAGTVLKQDLKQQRKEMEEKYEKEILPLMKAQANGKFDPVVQKMKEKNDKQIHDLDERQRILEQTLPEGKKTRVGRRITKLVDILTRMRLSFFSRRA